MKEISDSNITKEISDPNSVQINQIVLSHSGRMLFAGTEAGTVRSYKFPLTGDYTEIQVPSRSIVCSTRQLHSWRADRIAHQF